ncbi:YSIRK-targeted triacylglycerol lipase [Staphylococcus simulans]
MKKNNQIKHHYAIRKLTVGAGSTLIASFMFMGLSASAHAEEQPQETNQTLIETKSAQENEKPLESTPKDTSEHPQIKTEQNVTTQANEAAKQVEVEEQNVTTQANEVEEQDVKHQETNDVQQTKPVTQEKDVPHVESEMNVPQQEEKPKSQVQPNADVSDSQKDTSVETQKAQKIAEQVVEQAELSKAENADAKHIEPSSKTKEVPLEDIEHVQNASELEPATKAPQTPEAKSNPTPQNVNEKTEETQSKTTQRTVQDKNNVDTSKAKQSINDYPVIFVHGFMGFTGEIKPDLYPNYWGGDKYRVIDGLREKGYEAYEASVGAFSSNYDRAVELYYYIKGGTVDYGAAHAEKYGHSRYGRTYEGVFHDWQPGNKVHLVGHSMGGQTIRLLEHFLRFGNQEEIDYQRQHGGTISPLFEGGKDHMISSITTLGTPHNGSAAADRIGNEKAFKEIVYALGRMGGGKLANIDFGFEKWGFKQGENESYIEYAQRVANSAIWDTDDNAMYDLTLEGSEKLNQMTPMNPNIVYTTYTGLASHEGLTGNYVPDIGQFFLFDTTSRVIGSEENKALRPNDGIVSVVSSLYPTGQAYTDFTDGLKKGVWQVTPVMKGWDHLDFVGLDALDFKHTGQELQDFYAGLINHMMRVEELDI